MLKNSDGAEATMMLMMGTQRCKFCSARGGKQKNKENWFWETKWIRWQAHRILLYQEVAKSWYPLLADKATYTRHQHKDG